MDEFIPESLREVKKTAPPPPEKISKHETFRLTTKPKKPLKPEEEIEKEKAGMESAYLLGIVFGIFILSLGYMENWHILCGFGVGILLVSLKQYFKN